MKDFIGTTTEESMTSGVHYGMLNEMNGFIQIYKNRFKNLHVVITGGDELLFVRLLNFSIFAAPNLIPVGLNEILKHNYKHL
jgi:type III pantothenate kinase